MINGSPFSARNQQSSEKTFAMTFSTSSIILMYVVRSHNETSFAEWSSSIAPYIHKLALWMNFAQSYESSWSQTAHSSPTTVWLVRRTAVGEFFENYRKLYQSTYVIVVAIGRWVRFFNGFFCCCKTKHIILFLLFSRGRFAKVFFSFVVIFVNMFFFYKLRS